MALLKIVLLPLLLDTTLAQMMCQGCRPLQYQTSPSIGLDFTMSYGTAAVQFRNGTIIDVVKIDGTKEYQDVMKQLADDVQREQRGQSAEIPRFQFRRDAAALVYDPNWSGGGLSPAQKAVKAAMKPFADFLGAPEAKQKEPLPSPDRWTKPLYDMTVKLTKKVFEVAPDAEKFALFSGPDSLRVSNTLFPRLRHALQLAGIQEWGKFNAAASRTAVSHLKFGRFAADRKFSYGKTTFKALVITHTETAMTLADVKTTDGVLYDIDKTAAFVKPPVKHTKQQFTQNVRMALQQFVKIEKNKKEFMDLEYDQIILLGSLADRTEFKDGIDLVFGDKIKDSSGKSKIRIMTAEDQLYAAARGAAEVGREGLETAFNSCTPDDSCPRPEPAGPVENVETVEIEVNEGYTHAEL